MTSKSLYPLKFAALIALSLISLPSMGYSTPEGGKPIAQRDRCTVVNKQMDPIKIAASLEDRIVNFGMGLLGTPYAEAGSGKKGFDCSGFVYYVFQHFKIQVPRSSAQFRNFGKEIPIDRVRKGDILVFLSPTRNAIGHVGIVTNPKGKDSDFIHSSSSREMKVMVSSLKQQGYARRLVRAVRVL